MKNFGKGTLVIAAAGNEDTMKRSLPAAYSDVVAVGNVESSKEQPFKAKKFKLWYVGRYCCSWSRY